MKFYIFYFFIIIQGLLNYSCNNVQKEIQINTKNHDICYFFIDEIDTLKFERIIEIKENTITDTIIMGHSILIPNQIGIIKYTKFKDQNDITLDLDYANPPADRICISRYRGRFSEGKLLVNLKLTNKK